MADQLHHNVEGENVKGVKVIVSIENKQDGILYIGTNDTITSNDGYPINGHSMILLDVSRHKPPIYGFFKHEEIERLV